MDIQRISSNNNDKTIEMFINQINIDVINNDKIAIKEDVRQILEETNRLIKLTRSDKRIFRLHEYINKNLAGDPTIRFSACENFQEYINQILIDLDFEKDTLYIIKNYLKYCKKFQDYEYLALSFTILVGILALQRERLISFETEFKIYNCATKGINYTPAGYLEAKDVEGIEILKSDIKASCKLLTRKK